MKDLPSQSLALDRRHLHRGLDRLRRRLNPPRASSFVIGRANPPTLELASEDPDLFLNGGDRLLLGPVEPAGQRDKQELHDWNGCMKRRYPQAQLVVASSHKTSERDRVNIWTLRGLT